MNKIHQDRKCVNILYEALMIFCFMFCFIFMYNICTFLYMAVFLSFFFSVWDRRCCSYYTMFFFCFHAKN